MMSEGESSSSHRRKPVPSGERNLVLRHRVVLLRAEEMLVGRILRVWLRAVRKHGSGLVFIDFFFAFRQV